MRGPRDFIPFCWHAFFPQRLIEQISLPRRNHFISRAVHQQHRRAVLADIRDGVGRRCRLRIRKDSAVLAAKHRTAVDPQSLRGPSRLMQLLHLGAEIHADLRRIRNAVQIDRTAHAAGLLKVLAFVELRRAAGRAGKRGKIAARAASDDADPVFVDIPLIRMRPEIADGCLHILQRLRELGRRCHPIGDAGHHIALFRQIVPELHAVIAVGVDETAAGHKNDGRHL